MTKLNFYIEDIEAKTKVHTSEMLDVKIHHCTCELCEFNLHSQQLSHRDDVNPRWMLTAG